MADVIEVVPPAVDASGNLTIFWVPTIANILAPTALEIKAGKRLTYSFIPGGWAPTADQAVDTDERLTMPEILESFGKKTSSLTLGYVDSEDPASAAVVLVEGLPGHFVERRNIPNRTDVIAAQKVRVHPVTLGEQTPVAPPETGKFTIAQKAIYRQPKTGLVAIA